MKRHINLDYPTQKNLYLAELADHPHFALIEELMVAQGVPVEEVRHEGVDTVSWNYYTESKLAAWIVFHRTARKEIYITFTVAFATIHLAKEAEIATHFLNWNRHLRFPMRYVIFMPGVLAVQFDSLDRWLTAEHLKHRFNSIFDFASSSYRQFQEIGLLPLCPSWFQKSKGD